MTSRLALRKGKGKVKTALENKIKPKAKIVATQIVLYFETFFRVENI
jgi:hypothetical protein